MFIKDDRIYAEAGFFLQNGPNIGSSMPLELKDGAEEKEIDFSDIQIRRSGDYIIAVCSQDKMSYLIPDSPTFDSIKAIIVNGRYSNEEQTSIVVNKDNDDVTQTEYNRLDQWLEYAEKATKILCPLVGVEIVETLDSVKRDMIKTITKYDSSSNVNNFKFNGKNYWIDKSTRVGLMNSTAILQNQGIENTTLWLNDFSVTLPCSQVILMLSQLEVYALECFNVTAEHKAKVNAMRSIAKIKAFDYTADYPEQLSF